MERLKTRRQFVTLFTLVTTVSFSQIKTDYKKPALDILTETYKVLEKRIETISDVELHYVPKDKGWSVLNNLEHLAIVEKALHHKLKELISAGESPEAVDLSKNDWLIITQVTDRTNKVKTAETLEPQADMKDKDKTYFMGEIKTYRDKTIHLINSADVDLRKVIGPYLYGKADALQQATIIGAHAYRHTMQIEEILKEINELETLK